MPLHPLVLLIDLRVPVVRITVSQTITHIPSVLQRTLTVGIQRQTVYDLPAYSYGPDGRPVMESSGQMLVVVGMKACIVCPE